MIKDAIYFRDLIRNRQISPEELLDETYKKIEELNPNVNAIVRTRFDKAYEELKFIDSKTPFYGVPITTKDLGQFIEGEKNTSGAPILANFVSDYTDNYVKSIQKLGFVVVGQTATPEFGFTNFTKSDLFGTTVNPVDTQLHAGGSSGGAAASVKSGMLSVAGASDGGGSIRIPASWCGLIGLKPSRGRIATGPYNYRGWQGASSNFFLTQSMRDTRELLYAMQVEQFESPFTLPLLQYNDNAIALKDIKIAYSVYSPIGTPVSDDAVSAVLKTVALLKEKGITVEEAQPSIDGKELMRAYYLMNAVECASMFSQMDSKLNKENMTPISWILYQAGIQVSGVRYTQALQVWDKANAIMMQFHKKYPIWLTPTTATSAPSIDTYAIGNEHIKLADYVDSLTQFEKEEAVWDMFLEGLTLTPFTQLANLTGQPAISLPIYQTVRKHPIGVQLMSAKGREDLLFVVGNVLEEYFE